MQNAKAGPSRETDLQRELPASLRPTHLAFSSNAPYEPTTLSTLPALLYDVPPSTYASKLSSKTVALSNPPRPSSNAALEAKAKTRRESDSIRRKTVGLLSRSEGKRKAVWHAHPNEVQYGQLKGLSDLWEAYMVDLLGLALPTTLRLDKNNLLDGNPESFLQKIAKAEFVGCTLRVKEAPNADLVGVSGIVIHETAQTFKLVTKKSAVKVIPKDKTIFTLSIPLPTLPQSLTLPSSPPPSSSTPQTQRAKVQLDLFGAQFLFRSSDRAGRKFKTHGKTEMGGCAGMKI